MSDLIHRHGMSFHVRELAQVGDLYYGEPNEDGERPVKAPQGFQIRAECPYGERWDHNHVFLSLDFAEEFCDHVHRSYYEKGRGLNPLYWIEQRPVYGSEAYVDQNCEADLIAWERQHDW